MATSDYWSGSDLAAIDTDGIIAEDVLNQIWDISNIPLPVQDMLGTSSHSAAEFDWTKRKLADPDVTNAQVDGRDSTTNDAAGRERVRNRTQISTKDLQVTTRANAVDVIGASEELADQVAERQKELRRDVDAILLWPQTSVDDDNDTVAGKTGTLPSWLETNTDRGTGGTDGGYNTTTTQVDAPGAGEARALSEETVRDISEGIYNEGGNPSYLMSVGTVIRKFSEYCFTTSARIATLQSDQGDAPSPQTAKGSVNVFVTDFDTVLKFVPNRLQQRYNSTDTTPVPVADVFFIDPALISVSFLIDYRIHELAKAGLAEKRCLEVQYGLKVYNERGLGVIADIDPTLAAVA